MCCKVMHVGVVNHLLSQGANKDATNNKGEKPYDVAKTEEIKKLLS